MSGGVVNLCSPLMHQAFSTRLEGIEYAAAHGRIDLEDYEQRFLDDLRKRFDGRADDLEFGVTPWSPTRKQYNFLDDIFQRVGR